MNNTDGESTDTGKQPNAGMGFAGIFFRTIISASYNTDRVLTESEKIDFEELINKKNSN